MTNLASRSFSSRTLRALAARGISILGITAIPDCSAAMPYADPIRAFNLDDNGTHRVRTFVQVLELAGVQAEPSSL